MSLFSETTIFLCSAKQRYFSAKRGLVSSSRRPDIEQRKSFYDEKQRNNSGDHEQYYQQMGNHEKCKLVFIHFTPL